MHLGAMHAQNCRPAQHTPWLCGRLSALVGKGKCEAGSWWGQPCLHHAAHDWYSGQALVTAERLLGAVWEEGKAQKPVAMMEAAIQRRPLGSCACTQASCINSQMSHTQMSQAHLLGVTLCDMPAVWEEGKAQKLVAMMEAAIQRRFPAGVKLHVHSSDRFGCLAELTQTLQDSSLSITRAKVSLVDHANYGFTWQLLSRSLAAQPWTACVPLMRLRQPAS